MHESIILTGIMIWVDRDEELQRLKQLSARRAGGLAVVYGRRRIGKTRLLLEWAAGAGGLYTVADVSASEIQRRYFAQAVSERLTGFADVDYPDWRSLLTRLAREARVAHWQGPIILDEFPYLVLSSPELPSVMQRWIDHEAQSANLVVAIAGSSQRMMQGLVLGSEAPLYGRARETLRLGAIDAKHLSEAFSGFTARECVEAYTAWGGVPHYWELASELQGSTRSRIERLALDPLGVLHSEPNRVLIEDIPPALEARPLLDAIGSGANRLSEIAGRVGRPATSMSRPLERLIGMGLVRKELPFGESERQSRRSLYRIDDPFFQLWFRVVAPHRGHLAQTTTRGRRELLDRYWGDLIGHAWEDLCRLRVPKAHPSTTLSRRGPWAPASRWWKGTMPEWDLVSTSLDGQRLLLGEVRWSAAPVRTNALERAIDELMAKVPPELPPRMAKLEHVRALFVPEVKGGVSRRPHSPMIITAADLLR